MPDGTYKIEIAAVPLSDSEVDLEITTNLPLPVQIMVSLSLKGQASGEAHTGMSKRIGLTSETTRFTLGGRAEALPSGDYLAEARFYPDWGARAGSRAARRITVGIAGAADVTLVGTGTPRE